MTSRLVLKQRVVVAALAALTVWPLAHRALVATFDVNPWKLYGWAMFCVPNPRTVAELYEFADGEPVASLHQLLREPERQIVYEYAARRQILGTLASRAGVRTLVHHLLEERGHLRQVGLVVTQLKVDRGTARLVAQQSAYVFSR